MRYLLLSNLPWKHPGETNRQSWVYGIRDNDPDAEIYFVETLGFHWRPPSPQIEEVRVGDKGIAVLSAWNAVPFAAKAPSWPARKLNARLTAEAFRRHRLPTDFDVTVVFDPLASDLVSALASGRVIYDCLDHYDEQPQFSSRLSRRALRLEERRLASRSDEVIVSAGDLATRGAFVNRAARLVHGSLSRPTWVSEVNTPTQPAVDAPLTAVYVGALDPYKVDLAAFAALASLGPRHVSILICGGLEFQAPERNRDLVELAQLENVTLSPRVPRDELGAVLSTADFGLVCMTPGRYSRGSFPLKYWDYLWGGLPTLAVSCPSLRGLPGVVSVAGPSQISQRTLADIQHAGADRGALQSYAATHDATARVKEILA